MFRIVLAFFLFLFLTGVSHAAPCYGTRMPDKHKFFCGLESYTIFERELEKDYGNIKSNQGFYLLTYGLFDWFSIDLKVGVGDITCDSSVENDIHYPGRFDGGYGFRVKFYDNQKFKLAGGFQHISVHPFTVKRDGKKYKAVLDDWQVSAVCSYNISKLTPYIGTRYSRLDYINWVDNNRKRKMSDTGKSVGFIVGTDISLTDKFWINVEGEFFDSTALAASLNLKF